MDIPHETPAILIKKKSGLGDIKPRKANVKKKKIITSQPSI
jgi:hypothetical protein